MAARDIARLALAAKCLRYPEPREWKTTRVRLKQYLGKLDQCGATWKLRVANERRGCWLRYNRLYWLLRRHREQAT
jgi:hypothetical protein